MQKQGMRMGPLSQGPHLGRERLNVGRDGRRRECSFPHGGCAYVGHARFPVAPGYGTARPAVARGWVIRSGVARGWVIRSGVAGVEGSSQG